MPIEDQEPKLKSAARELRIMENRLRRARSECATAEELVRDMRDRIARMREGAGDVLKRALPRTCGDCRYRDGFTEWAACDLQNDASAPAERAPAPDFCPLASCSPEWLDREIGRFEKRAARRVAAMEGSD